ECHAAFYRVVSRQDCAEQTESIAVRNLVNGQPYTVRMNMPCCPFQPGWVVFGSLTPWRGEWYWSGEQRTYQNVPEHEEATLRREMLERHPGITYRYCPAEAAQARAATRRQIEDFTWGPATGHRLLFSDDVRKRTAAALRERQALLAPGDDYTSPQVKREKLEKADELLDTVRFIGDAAIAAFFSADKDKARDQKRLEFAARISDYLAKGDTRQRPTAEVAALRSGQFPVTPFHWEVEFPEVFGGVAKDAGLAAFAAVVVAGSGSAFYRPVGMEA